MEAIATRVEAITTSNKKLLVTKLPSIRAPCKLQVLLGQDAKYSREQRMRTAASRDTEKASFQITQQHEAIQT